MRLDIGGREKEILSRLLNEHSRTLLHEIAKSDTRDFREGLQAELELTDRLRERLSLMSESDVFEAAAP